MGWCSVSCCYKEERCLKAYIPPWDYRGGRCLACRCERRYFRLFSTVSAAWPSKSAYKRHTSGKGRARGSRLAFTNNLLWILFCGSMSLYLRLLYWISETYRDVCTWSKNSTVELFACRICMFHAYNINICAKQNLLHITHLNGIILIRRWDVLQDF